MCTCFLNSSHIVVTTDVQFVHVLANANCTANVSCIFAAGSLANSCLVTMNTTNITREYTIQRGRGTLVAAMNVQIEFNESYIIEAVGIDDENETDVNYVWTKFIPRAQNMCLTLTSGIYICYIICV